MIKQNFSAFLLLLACGLLLSGCVKEGQLRVSQGSQVEVADEAPASGQPPYLPQGGAVEPTAAAQGPAASATPAATAPAQPSTAEVSVSELGFDPISVSVSTGSKVKFTNGGLGLHDVVFIDRESEALAPGESYETAFAEAGSYGFSDSFNPGASGTIEVS